MERDRLFIIFRLPRNYYYCYYFETDDAVILLYSDLAHTVYKNSCIKEQGNNWNFVSKRWPNSIVRATCVVTHGISKRVAKDNALIDASVKYALSIRSKPIAPLSSSVRWRLDSITTWEFPIIRYSGVACSHSWLTWIWFA